MAAPYQYGLKFYSSYTQEFNDPAIQEFILKYKGDGYLFLSHLRAFIFSQGNFVVWSSTNQLTFAKMYGYSVHDPNIPIYLEELFRLKILNRHLYNTYKVLTSSDIQETFLKCKSEGQKVVFVNEYLLISFLDYKYLKCIVHIFHRDVDNGTQDEEKLILRFRKKGGVIIDPESEKPIKGIGQDSFHKFNDVNAIPGRPAQVQPVPAPPASAAVRTGYSYQQVMDLIRKSYENQTDNFRSIYSKAEFEAYANLYKRIDKDFPTIRKSDNQVWINYFVEFTGEMSATGQGMYKSLIQVSKQPINKETDIYKLLARYYDQSPEADNQAEDTETEQPVEGAYVPDTNFEKEVYTFFGFNDLQEHHKSHVLVRDFCTVQFQQGKLDYFKEQFRHYVAFKTLTGLHFKHGMSNFLGKQKERFDDGVWDTENWDQKLKEERLKTKPNNNGTAGKNRQANPQLSENGHRTGYTKP